MKIVKVYAYCPICRGKIRIGLTEFQLEEAHKALERQKDLDLTKEAVRKVRPRDVGG